MDSSDNDDTPDTNVVSLDELVDENENREMEEMTMRGQASENECTYEKGYVNRQGIFACKTCQDMGCQPAAICYGCSIQCHEDHDVYELWSKRHYRCDCGNDRFKGAVCKLNPKKDNINVKNNYDNHNLSGLYCTCNQPYTGNCSMVLCCICEDWFHPEHIGVALDEKSESNIICPGCSNKFTGVLIPYFPLYCESYENVRLFAVSFDMPAVSEVCLLPQLEANMIKNMASDISEAVLKEKLTEIFNGNKATIWQQDWRVKLCTCEKCKYMYELEGLTFLIDQKDTIEWYLENAKSPDDDIKQMLEKLDRPMQVEVLSMMHDFREQLQQFFQSCSDAGRVVTERDVMDFFEKLKSQLQDRPTLPDRCNQPHQ